MKKISIIVCTALLLSTAAYSADKTELTVYTYESMDWLKKSAVPLFEKNNNCAVKIVKFTDAGNIVARLKLESSKPSADCAVGLTPSLVYLAKKNDLLEKYRSSAVNAVEDKKILFDPEYATPYDYGALAIIYDPQKIKNELVSFNDLLSFKKGLIIQDPRTSSTGQDFLLWTISAYGNGWKDYWKKLKGSILTITPGWDESFAKFEAGEAPMMLSYATDGAYSWQNYKSLKYKAFIPNEGGYVQIESSSLVKGSKNPELSKKFIDFMLSNDVQKEIPLNQWMFPVTKTTLPDCFKYAVRPKTILTSDPEVLANADKYIKEWQDIAR
jgi:thiamine transport system substrate-binding protein